MLDSRCRDLRRSSPHTEILLAKASGLSPTTNLSAISSTRLVAILFGAKSRIGLKTIPTVARSARLRGGEAVIFGCAEFLAGLGGGLRRCHVIADEGEGIGLIGAAKIFEVGNYLRGSGD